MSWNGRLDVAEGIVEEDNGTDEIKGGAEADENDRLVEDVWWKDWASFLCLWSLFLCL